MAPIDTSPFTPIPPSAATRINKLSLTKKRRLIVEEEEEQSGLNDDDPLDGVGTTTTKRSRLLREEQGGCCDDHDTGMSSYHNPHHHHHHHPLSYMGGLGNGVAMISGSKATDVLANGGNSKYSSSSSSSSAATNSAASKSPSIASLCNLGNTCFLNSVLYTLRFTPGFLHNLHHMWHDLSQHNGGSSSGGHAKNKRNNGHTTNGFSSSNGHTDSDSSSSAVATASSKGSSSADGEMVQEVIEQLHDLFKSLSLADDNGDSREPIPPSNFLNAVGKLNPLFEGNQQQDAHELLVMILNTLQDIKIPAAAAAAPATELSATLAKESNGDAYISPAVDKKGKLLKKGGGKSQQQNGGSTFIQNGINKDSHASAGRSSPSSLPPLLPHRQLLPPVMLPNFVRDNFEGKAVMSTRCLECEMSTFRSEAFIFIDVPLHLDDDDDELSGKDLFLKQIMMSETLRENNKYWCEECSRLNEAQRSVHYELLPRVMVLQLKRFTATGSKYMSKINDYIPTPFTMNCFCHECMPASSSSSHPCNQRLPHQQQQQSDPKHHYRLYAVIMHLGATLASGHYIAYVRASPDAVWDQSQCQRVSTVERNKNKKGILKFLRRNNESKNGDASNGGAGTNGGEVGNGAAGTSNCRSGSCCGIRGGFVNTCLDGVNGSGGSLGGSSVSSSSTASLIHQRSSDSDAEASAAAAASLAGGGESSVADDLWLECDDESIQVITRKQFEEILGAKQGATTPYLLFYQRV